MVFYLSMSNSPTLFLGNAGVVPDMPEQRRLHHCRKPSVTNCGTDANAATGNMESCTPLPTTLSMESLERGKEQSGMVWDKVNQSPPDPAPTFQVRDAPVLQLVHQQQSLYSSEESLKGNGVPRMLLISAFLPPTLTGLSTVAFHGHHASGAELSAQHLHRIGL